MNCPKPLVGSETILEKGDDFVKDETGQKSWLLGTKLSSAVQARLVEDKLLGINVCVEQILNYESLMPALTNTDRDCDVRVVVTAHIYVSGFENVPVADAVIAKLSDNAVKAIKSLTGNQDVDEKGDE